MHSLLEKELQNVRKRLEAKKQKLEDLTSFKHSNELMTLRKEFSVIAEKRKSMPATEFLEILDEMSIKEEKIIKIIKMRDKKGISKIIDEEIELEQAIYEINMLIHTR